MKMVFVCSGNACRSAVAEVVLRKMLADKGISGVEAASCGTKVYGTIRRDETMIGIADEHGYDLGGVAVAMTEELLNSADRIVVMTEHHRNEVTRLLTYSHWDRIVRFNELCFGEATDVPDPNFQTEYVYRCCFDTIERGCRRIVDQILEKSL
ncbi:MAG: hypothetical protein ACI304_09685 [Lepagella sp.]